jgi:hypothetical protein
MVGRVVDRSTDLYTSYQLDPSFLISYCWFGQTLLPWNGITQAVAIYDSRGARNASKWVVTSW